MIKRGHNGDVTTNGLLERFAELLGPGAVLSGAGERLAYQSDAYTLEKAAPLCTVLPGSTEEVAAVVRLCCEASVAYAPRGAGTGKSGGTLLPGGVLIGLARMNRILSIDIRNRRLTAQAGAPNVALSKAVLRDNMHYAPDPSSQAVSTLGGNIANNAGGPHTLKYGVTANHLLEIVVVMPDGEIARFGGASEDAGGYDMVGLFCGAEGTLGIVTEATVRLTPLPESVRTLLAVYPTVRAATESVGAIMGQGITPAALELMDATTVSAVEGAFKIGLPLDAAAVLIIEIDGVEEGIEDQVAQISALCLSSGASEARSASTPLERARLWESRKKAVAALGRIKPAVVTQDGVIPRSQLPEVLEEITAIASRHNVRIANVFHAGDGNLHPVICYDERDEDEVRRVIAANGDILKLCITVGGSISGEHGIGVEKRDFMPLLFPADTLDMMQALRSALNPDGLCNPDKVLPTSHGCSYELLPLRRGAVSV